MTSLTKKQTQNIKKQIAQYLNGVHTTDIHVGRYQRELDGKEWVQVHTKYAHYTMQLTRLKNRIAINAGRLVMVKF